MDQDENQINKGDEKFWENESLIAHMRKQNPHFAERGQKGNVLRRLDFQEQNNEFIAEANLGSNGNTDGDGVGYQQYRRNVTDTRKENDQILARIKQIKLERGEMKQRFFGKAPYEQGPQVYLKVIRLNVSFILIMNRKMRQTGEVSSSKRLEQLLVEIQTTRSSSKKIA